MSGARFAVLARRARVLLSPSQATRNLSFLEVSAAAVTLLFQLVVSLDWYRFLSMHLLALSEGNKIKLLVHAYIDTYQLVVNGQILPGVIHMNHECMMMYVMYVW